MTFFKVIASFGLEPSHYTCDRITTGHINFTYRLTGNHNSYILQRININVFRQPDRIAANLRNASVYLKATQPSYFFPGSLPAKDGKDMVYDEEGFPWRLFPYINNTISMDQVDTQEEAYSAAYEFGKLTAYLWNDDTRAYQETIPRFHDLSLRFDQFQTALQTADPERKKAADAAIARCLEKSSIVDQYKQLIESGRLALHVMHNDTKINNILFDKTSRKAVCVIDLDTLMPGYFIYDLGDMIRTFVSPVSEEEKDFSQIVFRRGIYVAVINGYFEAMANCLTAEQKSLAPFAGQMMTYIMALRFLTDYLQGDIYYQTHYREQNLTRAQNQLHLLRILQTELN